MTNKELRAQLLIEAADALEESSGRNGVLARYRKAIYEKTKDAPKHSDEHQVAVSSQGWNNKRHGGYPESKYWGRDAAISKAKYGINEPDSIRIGKDRASHSKNVCDGNSEYLSSDIYRGIDRYDRSDRKSNHIHDTIRDNVKYPGRYGSEEYRAKSGMYKAKNESVADLLMEAAYMLMDDED